MSEAVKKEQEDITKLEEDICMRLYKKDRLIKDIADEMKLPFYAVAHIVAESQKKADEELKNYLACRFLYSAMENLNDYILITKNGCENDLVMNAVDSLDALRFDCYKRRAEILYSKGIGISDISSELQVAESTIRHWVMKEKEDE